MLIRELPMQVEAQRRETRGRGPARDEAAGLAGGAGGEGRGLEDGDGVRGGRVGGVVREVVGGGAADDAAACGGEWRVGSGKGKGGRKGADR